MKELLTALYFSPTHGSRKLTRTIAGALAIALKRKRKDIDLTASTARDKVYSFGSDEVLVLGFPVYGGRVPDVLTETFTQLSGQGTPVIIVATYGNRDYDDALLEARDMLTQNGFIVIAAGAFLAEHSFSKLVGAHRPDTADLETALSFAKRIAMKILYGTLDAVTVKGTTPYKERSAGLQDEVKTSDACTECMLCAHNCPVGCINEHDPRLTVNNTCIHCCACVKFCPVHAKSFESEKMLQFTAFLEKNCIARKEPELFEQP